MVLVITKTGMTLTFNYQGQGHFRKKMVKNITFLSKKVRFFLLIRNDKSLRVKKNKHVTKVKRCCKTNEYVFGGYTRLYSKYKFQMTI